MRNEEHFQRKHEPSQETDARFEMPLPTARQPSPRWWPLGTNLFFRFFVSPCAHTVWRDHRRKNMISRHHSFLFLADWRIGSAHDSGLESTIGNQTRQRIRYGSRNAGTLGIGISTGVIKRWTSALFLPVRGEFHTYHRRYHFQSVPTTSHNLTH